MNCGVITKIVLVINELSRHFERMVTFVIQYKWYRVLIRITEYQDQ